MDAKNIFLLINDGIVWQPIRPETMAKAMGITLEELTSEIFWAKVGELLNPGLNNIFIIAEGKFDRETA